MSDFSVAAVFSNHCVLQRDKVISIFGTAQNGNKILVELFDKNHELVAKKQCNISRRKMAGSAGTSESAR